MSASPIEPDSSVPGKGDGRGADCDERFRAIFECDIVGLIVVELESKIVREANPGFLAATGLERDECVGARFDLLSIMDAEVYRDAREEFFSTGRITPRRVHLLAKNDVPRFVTITASRRSYQGADCMIGFVVDETERTLTESRVRAMFEGMQLGAALFDHELRPAAVNEAALAALSITRDEFLRSGFSRLDFDSSDCPPWVEAGATNSPVRREVELGGRWFVAHAEPVRAIGTGRKLGVFVTFLDVTDLKRATADLEKALEAKGTLMREVQHRIKNNLAMLSSMMGIALRRTKSADAQRELAKTRDRIAAMGKLYDYVYRSGVAGEAVELSSYLEELARNIMGAYEVPGIRLETAFDRCALDLKRATAVGLVFMELVGNAMRYAYPSGAGEIRASLGVAGGTATLAVDDDGTGGSGVATDSPDSTGTGRLICQALAEDLDGRLAIEEGGGTRCSLSFPVERDGKGRNGTRR